MNPKVMDAVGYISRFVNDHWDSMVDSTEVHDELSNQGFSTKEITDAFRWIEANTLGAEHAENKKIEIPDESRPPMRILTTDEKLKLSPSAQGVLMSYFERGVIDAIIFEEILERVMRSEPDEVSEKEVRRITSLTLFTRIQEEWIELLHSTNTLIH